MARPRTNPLTVDKICPTCDKPFTISYRKKHQTYCSKTCSVNSAAVLAKSADSKQKTYDEKYGGLHPMQTEQTQKNFREAMIVKYGVAHALQNKELIEKRDASKLERYGDKNYNNTEKMKQTCL